jgi:hypothetical protein
MWWLGVNDGLDGFFGERPVPDNLDTAHEQFEIWISKGK